MIDISIFEWDGFLLDETEIQWLFRYTRDHSEAWSQLLGFVSGLFSRVLEPILSVHVTRFGLCTSRYDNETT